MPNAEGPPNEGAFDFHPDHASEELREILRAHEYVALNQNLRARRTAREWTGPFIVSIHRLLFGDLYPQLSGTPRQSAILFGARAGVEPENIYDCLRAVAEQFQSDLDQALAVQHDLDSLLEHVFRSAAVTHAEMIRVHPFVDGNGRWARFVTNLYVFDCGLEVGTIILAKDKKRYIDAMNRASDNREPGDLANILLQGFLFQANRQRSGRPRR
jgi:fido (protein-threonine AMPylation protein)